MRIEKDQMLTVGIVLALGVLFAFAVWMPASQQDRKLEQRIDAAKDELGMTAVAKDEFVRLNDRVSQLRRVVRGAQRYVPANDEIAEVVRGINMALRTHDVTEQEMIARQAKRYADFAEIPLSVEFESSFPVVFGALEQIESMPRLIRVDRLSLMSFPDEPARPLEVQMQMSTFYTRAGEGASR